MIDTSSFYAPFLEQKAIDVTAFIGTWPTRYQSRATAADLSAMADRLQLEAMCVSHIASVHGHDTRSGNEALFAESASDDRLLPFVILNPAETNWEAELEWAAASGAKGVRLVPGYHGYDPAGSDAKALYAAVRRLRLPLQIIVRLLDERLQHPRFTAEHLPFHIAAELIVLLEGHPVLLSGFRENEWEQVKRMIPQGAGLEHVCCDLWFCNGPLAVISKLCARGESERFAYGSCTPIQSAEATALQLAAAAVGEADRAMLCRGNASRYLSAGE